MAEEKTNQQSPAPESEKTANFIRDIIAQDLASGKVKKVVTRFPPEPNGYLHIGHAKAISIDFGMAMEFGGECHLRYDDTNPSKEDQEYVDAIQQDVRWLGYDWGKHLYYASDYFQQMYQWAVHMIKAGTAYVCDLSADQMREYRGTLTQQGKESPYRNRTVDENLDLFERMFKGEFPDGSRTLRAKIDMASPNLNMRDPAMYRIVKKPHHRQGDAWCIYPMYDWAQGNEDAIEGVTHSLCSLEFENHRPLYDWFLRQAPVPCVPQQREFARLNLTYTVMSKRKLLQLVEEKYVSSWDDPRMPTICGMRRRGYTPEAIRAFCEKIGVAKRDSMVEVALLEHCVRDDLNRRAPRAMAVLHPLKVVIDNYQEGKTENLDAVNNPEDPSMGSRKVPFSKVLFIEKDDFMLDPPRKFFRLSPGREVRLRYGYFITCTSVEKNAVGDVTAVHCTYDAATRGGSAPDGRSPKSTMHWVSAQHSVSAEIRLYDYLLTKEDPADVAEGMDFKSLINPQSLVAVNGARLEPALADAKPGDRFQFERVGYFCADSVDSKPGKPVFNRTASLKDTWAKIQKKQK
ncbi:MAG TPA: glutamine--tRNA ligase/YqeY domain fusion protein [Chitinivibrionales bacterium]|jgi:glutaminyl-tRNA synthetase|nr:glutamine--tRNA ligase/YqeY domain fusion protein [Chitinivibrionales bacterium]